MDKIYVTLGERGVITLPAPIRNLLGMEAGDLLCLAVEEGRVLIEPGSFLAKVPKEPPPLTQPANNQTPKAKLSKGELVEGITTDGKPAKGTVLSAYKLVVHIEDIGGNKHTVKRDSIRKIANP